MFAKYKERIVANYWQKSQIIPAQETETVVMLKQFTTPAQARVGTLERIFKLAKILAECSVHALKLIKNRNDLKRLHRQGLVSWKGS